MRRVVATCVGLLVAWCAATAQILFVAKLDGTQETPPVSTSASGTGVFILNADGTELYYNITVNGLNVAAAHIHNAASGMSGPVVKMLTFNGNTTTGVWRSSDADQPFTEAMLIELLRGRLYVNIHTGANPNGEIRGQIQLAGPVTFTATLDGSQETPPVSTHAAGTASFRLNPNGTVSYDITVTGLTPQAAHIHNAARGMSGPVVKNLTLVNNSASGTWTPNDPDQPLTDELLKEMVKGRFYINVHTQANPNGEIRGQILPQPGAVFTAKLEGTQEVPPVVTTASGTGVFVLDLAGKQLRYNITVNGLTVAAAHIHNAPAGQSGGVVKLLMFDHNNTSTGVWSSTDTDLPLTDSLVGELLAGRLYVNVHTSNNPNGELRGQILLTSAVGLAARLEGRQETPPVTTTATGTAAVRLNTDGTVSYDVTVTGLTPAAAHFHNAPIGQSGPVVKVITLTNNSASATWSSNDMDNPLTPAVMRELVRGNLYINVHTDRYPNGELRGQVLNVSDPQLLSVEPSPAVLSTTMLLEQNRPNPFSSSTVIPFTVPTAGMVTVKVYDIRGQEVATLVSEELQPGSYQVVWSADGVTSGAYVCRITVGGHTEARLMQVVK